MAAWPPTGRLHPVGRVHRRAGLRARISALPVYFDHHAPLACRDLRAPFLPECERIFVGPCAIPSDAKCHMDRGRGTRQRVLGRSQRTRWLAVSKFRQPWSDGRAARPARHHDPSRLGSQATRRTRLHSGPGGLAQGPTLARHPVTPSSGNRSLSGCSRGPITRHS